MEGGSRGGRKAGGPENHDISLRLELVTVAR